MLMIEITRLVLGLLIALFHKPLADFITDQDQQLVAMFRRRGVTLPNTMRRETAHTLFFCMGILVAMVEIGRLWMLIYR